MNKPKRHLTHDGHTAPLSYWAGKMGISTEALMQRLMFGWTVAEAVTTPKNNRTKKKIRRKLANILADAPAQTQAAPVPASVVFPPYEELKRQHLATQRQFNSLLRQFSRDLHGLMGRGVVVDLSKLANDRTISSARVPVQMVDS